MKNDYVVFSDAFRTYDVENVIAQPVTIQRVANLLPYKAQEGGARYNQLRGRTPTSPSVWGAPSA